jgi:hypothetical protein
LQPSSNYFGDFQIYHCLSYNGKFGLLSQH